MGRSKYLLGRFLASLNENRIPVFVQGKEVIRLEGVWKVFGERASEAMEALLSGGASEIDVITDFDCFVAVADCSLRVHSGEVVCIMGLSGSGKSTIIRHINRLLEPTSGKVTVLGKQILEMAPRELQQMRNDHLGMVFQHVALLPHLTVRENVSFPLRIRQQSQAHCWEVSEQCLQLVNLQGQGERFPAQLSGGMQQRVGLARALASDPQILLMDEPFSALDPLIRRQLQEEFIAISKRTNKTTVFITHDLHEAMRIGHRIIIMRNGRIVQTGTPQEIISHPADDYVREFVEDIQ